MLYQIFENPIALARPRFGKGNVYDSQKNEKNRDAMSIKIQHGQLPMFKGPIRLEVTFVFAVPQSYSIKKRQSMFGLPCDKHVDLDNLIKYLADVCHGVLYTNDQIITAIIADKIYGPSAKTQFKVVTLS